MIATSPAALLARTAVAAAPVDRNAAREAAQRELSKGIYHADDPGLFERLLDKVIGWLDDRLSDAANLVPGGIWGLLALVVALAGAVALVLWKTGPLRRTAAPGGADLELSSAFDADEHRRRADAFGLEGRYAEAVRERMRAIVRELEDRGVLEPRPGRTTAEIAREAGRVVPAVAGDLRTAARVFDEIWYGGRPATAGADAALREADQRVRTAPLTVSSTAPPGPAGYQVPR
jgi:hypothetical protein